MVLFDLLALPVGDFAGGSVEIGTDQRDFLRRQQVWLEIFLLLDLRQSRVIFVQLKLEEIDAFVSFQDRVDATVAGARFGMDVVAQQFEDGEEDVLEIRLVLMVYIVWNSREEHLQRLLEFRQIALCYCAGEVEAEIGDVILGGLGVCVQQIDIEGLADLAVRKIQLIAGLPEYALA